MVILVNSIEKEDDGNSFLRVIVMITPKEKPIRIREIIVASIVADIQVRLVDGLNQVAQFCAHHRRANQIDVVWTSQLSISWIGVTFLFTATDHIDIKLCDDVVERDCWVFSEV